MEHFTIACNKLGIFQAVDATFGLVAASFNYKRLDYLKLLKL